MNSDIPLKTAAISFSDSLSQTGYSTNYAFPTMMLMLTHHQLRGGQFTKYNVYRRFIISSFEHVVDENS